MRYYEFKIVESLLFELTDAVKNKMREQFKKENNLLTDDQINYYLDRWDQYQNTFEPQYRDITRLTFNQVERLIDDAVTKSQLRGRARPEKVFDQNDDLIYDKNNLVILKGDLREKCIQYGEGYSWCISRRDASNMFFSYRMRLNEPMFYFVFDKDKPTSDIWHAVVIYVDNKNIFHVATANNPGDKRMTWKEITKKQPKLKNLQKLFVHLPLTPEERADYEKYGKRVDLEKYQEFSLKEKYKYIQFGHVLTDEQQTATPRELIGVYAKQMPAEISLETLKRLSSGDRRKVIGDVVDPSNEINPVDFAKNVLNKPWDKVGLPEEVVKKAHDKIIKDLWSAYKYARDVIKGRWPEGEPVIAKDNYLVYKYALYVIKGRWLEAEPVIAKNPNVAYEYARDVIKDRWPEGEPAIAKNRNVANDYARDVIKGRWPEAEPAIAKDPWAANDYARDVIKRRWPEGEPVIAKNSYAALDYARDVIKGRWSKAEPVIAKNSYAAYEYARDVIRGPWPEAGIDKL